MNIAAFIIAILAVVCFVWEAFRLVGGRPKPVNLIPIGLALLSVAWMAQLIWDTTHTVVIH